MMKESTTQTPEYAARLLRLEQAGWKRFLPNPYRWHLRRVCPGRVLDIGCGAGRALSYLEGRGVGVDHNPHAVATCRARGLTAYTPEEFFASPDAGPAGFDSLLCSHVLEHVASGEQAALLRPYLACLRPLAAVVLITPQEHGHASDPSHVHFVDARVLRGLCAELALQPVRIYSFPLPRLFGRLFIYNETVLVARRLTENTIINHG